MVITLKLFLNTQHCVTTFHRITVSILKLPCSIARLAFTKRPQFFWKQTHLPNYLCRVKPIQSGLRGLGVTFPPHDPGSNPAEVVEFLRTEKFRERSPPGGTLSRLNRVVDLLHVKEPQAPEGPLGKLSVFPVQSRASNSSGRWWCAFYLSALHRKGLEFCTTVLW
jgi:hypothetical protein